MSTRALKVLAASFWAALLVLGSVLSTASAAEPDVVRFGWFGGPRTWTICKANSMFEKGIGTKVEWVQFPSGAAALTSLAAKQVDISRLGSTPTVAAIAASCLSKFSRSPGSSMTSERLIAKGGIKQRGRAQRKAYCLPPGFDRALRADGGVEGQQHCGESV